MRKNTFAFVLIAFFLIVSHIVYAQEMLGIVNSNYAGIDGIMINPASFAYSRYWLDINIVTAGEFLENNYLYVPAKDYKFSRFFQKDPQFTKYGKDSLYVMPIYNKRNKNAYENVRILGPSVGFTYGNHTFGLFTSARIAASANHVPSDISDFAYNELEVPEKYDKYFSSKYPIKSSALSWAEFGVNYAYSFRKSSLKQISAGASFKILKGEAGAYVVSKDLDYFVKNKYDVQVNSVNAEVGYSLPDDYSTNEYISSPLFRGSGVGIDIGIIISEKLRSNKEWSIGPLCSQPFAKYRYRLGISILDIGKINFSENAQTLRILTSDTVNMNLWNIDDRTVNTAVSDFSNRFYGNPTQILDKNKFSIGLPTALSVQYDVMRTENWYFNGTLVLPFKIFKNSVQRPSIIAFTPRYEKDFLEFSFPVSLYNFTKPHIGISARVGILYLGTDNLNGILGLTKVTGLDVYAGIKAGFRKGHCRSGSSKQKGCVNGEFLKFRKSKKELKPKKLENY